MAKSACFTSLGWFTDCTLSGKPESFLELLRTSRQEYSNVLYGLSFEGCLESDPEYSS